MKHLHWTPVALVLLASLTACGGGSSNSNGNINLPSTSTSTSSSRVQALASASATTEATNITDAVGLQQDLTSVLGSADAEPFAVNGDDTALSAINRAAGQ